jgi:hypothetical protein
MVPSQPYRGTHRHRAPVGWHPPRMAPERTENGQDALTGEPTQPFTPTFTGEQLVIDEAPPSQPLAAPAQPVVVPGNYQYLKRWKFVLVVAAVWIVSAAIGLGLYYWWFHSLDKTPTVFVVLIYLVVCTVGSLITAIVQDRPLVSAVSIALMSAPFAAVGAAAVLHGIYFCDRAARCLVGLIPY